jgi:integral membrane protein
MLNLMTVFRVVAFLEGLSFVLLLFIAVPLKYFSGNADYVKLLGMPHGLLFMVYVLIAVIIASELKWTTKMLSKILIAAIIPFGTFYVDHKYLSKI